VGRQPAKERTLCYVSFFNSGTVSGTAQIYGRNCPFFSLSFLLSFFSPPREATSRVTRARSRERRRKSGGVNCVPLIPRAALVTSSNDVSSLRERVRIGILCDFVRFRDRFR